MIRKGSLVKFNGKDRVIPPGKYLSVHDTKENGAIVWILAKGRWAKKLVKADDLEEVVE